MDIEIRGAEQLVALAKRLRNASKDLRSNLYRGINRAAKPLKGEIKQSALKNLPRKGGLNRRIAGSKIETKRRVSGNAAGVRLVGTSGYDIGSIDRGRIRHLTFGHEPWVDQFVTDGFWTVPILGGAPRVQDEIQGVMDDITKQLGAG